MNGDSTAVKKLIDKNFMIVPREEYREFSFWRRAVRINLDEKWFWTPEWQKKETEADKAIRAGQVSRSFSDHKKLISALKGKKK